MNFEQASTQLQDTLVAVAEIQRRQAGVPKTQADGFANSSESMRIHMQCMDHIDMRLAEITTKLNRLIDGPHPKQ